MFEKARAKPRNMLSVLVMVAMVLSAFPIGTAAGPDDGAGARAITDDSNDLTIPAGETYELFGCHTYKKSVQIQGVLTIKPYDGSDEKTGMLVLSAPNITIGGGGAIIGDGRGNGGGGGGSCYPSNPQGGKGGIGGKGGDGANPMYSYASGGGGGSNGGQGGAAGGNGMHTAGLPGTETSGGAGGGYSGWSELGGKGGSGYGGGGGGGGTDYYGPGGGGGGGSGGKDAAGKDGGKGAGDYGGSGGTGQVNGYMNGNPGSNGGYMAKASNGDASIDLNVVRGGGGGGGGTCDYGCGGAGGGGAGGAAVTLVAGSDLKIAGSITTMGGGGAGGGMYYGNNYPGGKGGGGAGGGIALSGLKVTLSGSVNALGREFDTPSATNGGTVKLLYADMLSKIGTIQGGREFVNGRPKMKGLDLPAANTGTTRKPTFSWFVAADPEKDPITYEIEIASNMAFTPVTKRAAGIEGTSWSPQTSLAGTLFWRVRAADLAGPGGWSEVRMFIVDDKAPYSRIDPLPEFSTSRDFTVSWTGTDNEGGSGIANYNIWVSDNGAPDSIWLANTPATSATFPGEEGHSYQLYSQARDLADNLEPILPEAKLTTTVDSIAPTCSITAMPAYQGKPNFMVSWSGRDVTSGIADYTVFVSKDGAAFELWLDNTTEVSVQYVGAEGHKYTFYVLARDIAGNLQAVPGTEKHVTTRVDGTAPVTVFAPSPAGYGEGPTYIRQSATIYLNGTDNAAGINRTLYTIDKRTQQDYTKGFREAQAGSHNITFWSVDEAGNEEAHRLLWFWVDGETPVTNLAFLGPNFTTPGKVFISERTMLTFDASDKASGINRTVYNIDGAGYVVYTEPFQLPKSGLHSMKYKSVDNLGQEDVEKNASVILDIWKPSSVALAESKTSGKDIVVELRGTDLESGLAGVFYRVTKKGEPGMNFVNGSLVTIQSAPDHSRDGTYILEYYAVDNVGNREDTRKMEFVIDSVGTLTVKIKGSPTVSEQLFHVIGNVEPGSTVTVNDLRVLVRPDGSFDYELELKDGRNKIVVVSTDKAGNIVPVTKYVTYTVDKGTGMLYPIIGVIAVVAVVGTVAFLVMRSKRRPKGAEPQTVAAPPPAPKAPPPVPPAK